MNVWRKAVIGAAAMQLVVLAHANAMPGNGKTQTYDDLIQEVLELTNVERADHNLGPLRINPVLTTAASWMAQDLANKNYFSHTDSLGRGIGERVPSFGYKNYRIIRENLAAGHFTAREVVDAWMQSPGHRKSILCATSTEIGIAFYYKEDSTYKRYWVQEFGKSGD